jgi:fumarate reductase subunit D
VKTLLLRLEPIIWLLFGGGIMVGTLLLPAYLIAVGLGGPLGLFPEGALDYERVHAIASHPVGRAVFAAIIILPLWKGAHHTRSLMADWLGHGADGAVGSLLYAIAVVGSVLGVAAVLAI